MTESKLGTAPTVSTMGAAESIWPPAVFARGFWSLARVGMVGWLVGVVGREDIEKKPWSPSLRGSNERLLQMMKKNMTFLQVEMQTGYATGIR